MVLRIGLVMGLCFVVFQYHRAYGAPEMFEQGGMEYHKSFFLFKAFDGRTMRIQYPVMPGERIKSLISPPEPGLAFHLMFRFLGREKAPIAFDSSTVVVSPSGVPLQDSGVVLEYPLNIYGDSYIFGPEPSEMDTRFVMNYGIGEQMSRKIFVPLQDTYLEAPPNAAFVDVSFVSGNASLDRDGEAFNLYVGFHIPSMMIEAHNKIRMKVQNETGASIPPLVWSDTIAQYAAQWANHLRDQAQCRMTHRSQRKYGENLAYGFRRRRTPEHVVTSWASEVEFFDYESNTCQSGQMCGHYTQVVWAETKEVGCARASCGDAEVWVCNYFPPGNVVSQRPY